MARPERFELPTKWFEATYSIQLSYGRGKPSCDQFRARMVLKNLRLCLFFCPLARRGRFDMMGP